MSSALFDENSVQVKVGRLESENLKLKREISDLHEEVKQKQKTGMFTNIGSERAITDLDLMEVNGKEMKLGR